MKPLILAILTASVVLVSSSRAEAQRAAGPGNWQHSGWVGPGRWHGRPPMFAGAQRRFPAPGAFALAPAQAPGVPMAPGVVTAPGFAARLGGAVGWSAPAPAAVSPGIGNINHPGMQPLPIAPQPLPTGSPFPVPNINFPGGIPAVPSLPPNFPPGQFPGRHNRGAPLLGPIIYTVPYYVPIYTSSPDPATAPAQPPLPYTGPYSTEFAPLQTQPPETQPPETRPAPSQGRRVTLLAFKDHTIIAVTDYWMEGDSLVYETSPGVRTPVPLDRLDFALTQQLNRERNVPFVLEARP